MFCAIKDVNAYPHQINKLARRRAAASRGVVYEGVAESARSAAVGEAKR
jgi:hypothetical protein